jgi:two-component system OmpR family response regulator
MNMTILKERPVQAETKEVTTHRILVVDDESSISDLISTSLRFVGFDVRTAANGAQALQVAEEFQPHAIVLDLRSADNCAARVTLWAFYSSPQKMEWKTKSPA